MRNAATSLCLIAGMGWFLGSPLPCPAADQIKSDKPPTTGATPKALERAKKLKGSIKSLDISLDYRGPKHNHYFSLGILNGPGDFISASSYSPIATQAEPQLLKIIDRLTTDGFLERAEEVKERWPQVGPEDRYTLMLTIDNGPDQTVRWHEDLGWGLQLVPRMESLRAVMEGRAATVMDKLIAALRKDFESPPANSKKSN